MNLKPKLEFSTTKPEDVEVWTEFPFMVHKTTKEGFSSIMRDGVIIPKFGHKTETSQMNALYSALTQLYPTGDVVNKVCWFYLVKNTTDVALSDGEVAIFLDTKRSITSIKFIPVYAIAIDSRRIVYAQTLDVLKDENQGLTRSYPDLLNTAVVVFVPYAIKRMTGLIGTSDILVTPFYVPVTGAIVKIQKVDAGL